MVNLTIYASISILLLQISARRSFGSQRKFSKKIVRRGALQQAESIQNVNDYLGCIIVSQLQSAALASGISTVVANCIPPSNFIPTPLTPKVNACTSLDPEVCKQQTLALEAHNNFRAKHHVAPLTWSDELAAAASRWLDNCEFRHSNGVLLPYIYGENLYTSTLTMPGTDMTTVIAAYTNEEADYDYSNPAFSPKTGHFTQVVWKDTTQVGCAIINCPVDTLLKYSPISSISSCLYFSAGNFKNEFADNVFPE